MDKFISIAVLAVVFCVSVTNGRVVDVSHPGDEQQGAPSINELLQNSDPYENDIFYEPNFAPIPVRRPSPPSPTLHLLHTLSRPRYVDASAFRRTLPPSLDINRQLTLISASKRVQPPPIEIIEPSADLQKDNSGTVYFTNPSPLYREDFPSEVLEDNFNDDAATVVEDGEFIPENRSYSTSVSVSSSVSYSNGTHKAVEHKPSTEVLPLDAVTSLTSASYLSTTTPTSEDSDMTLLKDSEDNSSAHTGIVSLGEYPNSEASPIIASDSVSEALVSAIPTNDSQFSEDRSSKHYGITSLGEYPDYGGMSPVAHILSGLRGEIGPFGGDFQSDRYIVGFRPDGF